MNPNSIYGDLISTKDGYKTCDLYLAALFATSGCKIKNTVIDQKKVYFYFEHSTIIEKLKSSYFLRQCPVDALTYADNIKSLKSLCASILISEPKKG
jgi:hypothetical protein